MKAQSLTTQEITGDRIMEETKATVFNKAILLMVAVLVMILSQGRVQAATNCVNDLDCDGFLDSEEGSIAGQPTSVTAPDLFVIVDPSSGSLFPSSPLETLTSAASDIGLNVHQISSTQVLPGTVRNITSTQKAVRVMESLYVGSYLGVSPQGNPDTTDDNGASVIYTKTITNTVTNLCTPPKGKALSCVDADGTSGQVDVINKYIKHTIAHETAHQLNLKYTCSPDVGCHYPQITSAGQSPTIMDQSVFYVKGRSSVTWYIGSQYSPADADFQLRP